MTFGPSQPAIGALNKDLAEINHLVRDPAYGSYTNHFPAPLEGGCSSAAGRIPYSLRSNVAISQQCLRASILRLRAPRHSGALKAQFFRYLERYQARWSSMRDGLLALLTVHLRQFSFPYCLTRRQIRQQHQANTTAIASSASSAFAVMSVSLFAQLRPETGVFLTARHEINTQPRKAVAGLVPCCTAGGGCHAH